MERLRLLLVLLALVGCATPISKGSHCIVEPGYLDNESTFTWYSEPAIDVDDETGYISPTILRVLEQSVVKELKAKGFTFVDPQASDPGTDLQIALRLKTRRELYSLSINESPCRTTDCWERIDMGANVRMDVRTVGFLSADLHHLGEPIWRGWVERELYPSDRDQAESVIEQAVPALFESFPP
jgi:hypothetical protein